MVITIQYLVLNSFLKSFFLIEGSKIIRNLVPVAGSVYTEAAVTCSRFKDWDPEIKGVISLVA